MDKPLDVAIVGAGPYGLSLAAHLQQRGLSYRVFGRPMQAWFEMSPGMFLRSFGFATSVYTPDPGSTFVDYCNERGLESFEPCPIVEFARYGQSIPTRLALDVDQDLIELVEPKHGTFQLTTRGGRTVSAANVVIATGLTSFARMPPQFAGLPKELVSHTAEHSDFARFRGQSIGVIGAGQSALQAAALLHENGAHVQLVARAPALNIYGRLPASRSLLERLGTPITVLGMGYFNWLLEHLPWAPHYLPDRKRVRLTLRHLGPSGSWWLRDRIEGKFPLHLGSSVIEARPSAGGITLRISQQDAGEKTIEFDHVIAGSGFEVDVDRFAFLDQALKDRIERIVRAPALSRRFESSVRGLFFVGPASALSFGPLFRFVAGAAYTAPLLARYLVRRTRASRARSSHAVRGEESAGTSLGRA